MTGQLGINQSMKLLIITGYKGKEKHRQSCLPIQRGIFHRTCGNLRKNFQEFRKTKKMREALSFFLMENDTV